FSSHIVPRPNAEAPAQPLCAQRLRRLRPKECLLMGWPGRAQRPKTSVEQDGEASKLKELTMHTHQRSSDSVATIGLDIGKNTFHLVGLDKRGAIVIRIKVSRNQLIRRLVNLPPCLLGLEAGSGSHHIARQIQALGHDVRLIPAQYVKPFLKGHKND